MSLQSLKKEDKNLYLFGRYIYLEIKSIKNLPFYIHLDFLLADGNRLNLHLGNQYKKIERKEMSIFVPLKKITKKWTIIVLDMHNLLKKMDMSPYYKIKRNHEFELIKGKLCANLIFKGIYTSNNRYDPSCLPRDLDFSLKHKNKWLEYYDWLTFPNDSEKENIKGKVVNQ